MNVLHMKYAVDVARSGSINKAAEEILVAQPNLSRCIKELEADLGITIFDRTSRGMHLTPEGEDFIHYAERALRQIDDIERLYKGELAPRQKFSITVPRASYIAYAFKEFSKTLDASPAEIYYMESNSSRAIRNILEDNYHLGIIRYAAEYDKYFTESLEEKGFAYETVAEFRYVIIFSRDNPLAEKDVIHFSDLENLIEIVHGDPYVPSLPIYKLKKRTVSEKIKRRIYLFERGGQFDILADNPETFMWVSPIPHKLFDRYGLVQRECVESDKLYRDVLIRRKDYNLSDLDKRFIAELYGSKHKWL